MTTGLLELRWEDLGGGRYRSRDGRWLLEPYARKRWYVVFAHTPCKFLMTSGGRPRIRWFRTPDAAAAAAELAACDLPDGL